MSEQKAENPTEKIKEDVQHGARVENTPASVRHDRAVLFQGMHPLLWFLYGTGYADFSPLPQVVDTNIPQSQDAAGVFVLYY
jgi:hypothetical protein